MALVGPRLGALLLVAFLIISELQALLTTGAIASDGYYHVGRFLMGLAEDAGVALSLPRWLSPVDSSSGGHVLWQHGLEILVRWFFGPLMFIGFCENLGSLKPRLLEIPTPPSSPETTEVQPFPSRDPAPSSSSSSSSSSTIVVDTPAFGLFPSFMSFMQWTTNAVFTVDLGLACIGYIAPFTGLVGAGFVSTEPTLLGWVVALPCYAPLFAMLTDRYLDYDRNPGWAPWLSGLLYGNKTSSGVENTTEGGQTVPENNNSGASNNDSGHDTVKKNRDIEKDREALIAKASNASWLFRAYGCTLLLLRAAFALCTAAFGLRYSNLAYRGAIVSSGPYAICTHPAYVTKLIAFALAAAPWTDLRPHGLGGGGGRGRILRNCITLGLLACLYRLRAQTEEAHLLSVDTSGDSAAYLASVDAQNGMGLVLSLCILVAVASGLAVASFRPLLANKRIAAAISTCGAAANRIADAVEARFRHAEVEEGHDE